MHIYTVFKVSNQVLVQWHGGTNFDVYARPTLSRAYTKYESVASFEGKGIKTLKDATEFVESWYNDLVGTVEIEDYS